ncbi:uncharacterized protein KY384_000820 [Bacidia gigantensis]|uniref:uncharacterized protein n=1 Tax=Bacidia gigantensis TaxID=2732470 RepID=UPI001D03E9F3|nr:uncharacterized protein KY384_000820 [Bacidia gigantensis]KAG8526058.1 hypothetical protein KY384_000820 [Bacidia gigantensis]
MAHFYDSSSDEKSDDERTPRDIVKDNLRYCINNVHSTGSFATFGVVERFANPGISIDPLGLIRLPLSEEDAKAIVRASNKAPFGKGNKTLVDESIRKTWQIDADKIQLLNDGWQECLNRIVEHVLGELGVACALTNVRADLYKMLLYEEGAMFKEHKDTEKIPGMFATLVICLPSQHTGGAVRLRHGQKSLQFATSERSAFDATFIAWYNDVTHEIEPVQGGRRWVLTYNLIKINHQIDQSASMLDAQIQQTESVLRQWSSLDDAPQALVYALEHNYTNRGLTLAGLKGADYHRARHMTQSCALHGDFFTLLANLEMHVTDMNGEDCEETQSEYLLPHIVDVNGNNLSVHRSFRIPDSLFLDLPAYKDRDPDVQHGGNYTGNQYAEIEQYFKDSVMIIVPARFIARFLLTSKYGPGPLANLVKSLVYKLKQNDDQDLRKMLHQVCEWQLSRKYKGKGANDQYLGTIAVAAVSLEDPTLFTKVVNELTDSFSESLYDQLGGLLWLDDMVVPEKDVIECLTKSGKLSQISKNIERFRLGYLRTDPAPLDELEKSRLRRWVDTVVFGCLHKIEDVHDEDATTLVDMIVGREEEPFSQFVLYQGARVFAAYFAKDLTFMNALLVELLYRLAQPSQSNIYLESLLQRILSPAFSTFNLSYYALSVKARDSRLKTLQMEIAGPAQQLYQRATAHEGKLPSRFLNKIEDQVPKLTNEQVKEFLTPFLHKMINVIDSSAPQAQKTAQILAATYIQRFVGIEPAKPTDWARPEEIMDPTKCDTKKQCKECAEMNAFLKDPEQQTFQIPTKPSGEISSHLRYRYDYFKNFEQEKGVGKRHTQWEERAAQAVSALQKLPQPGLKECLGKRYDEIVELRAVKVGAMEDVGEGGGEGEGEGEGEGGRKLRSGGNVESGQ